jgi:Protein of unknown function (DUF3352)
MAAKLEKTPAIEGFSGGAALTWAELHRRKSACNGALCHGRCTNANPLRTVGRWAYDRHSHRPAGSTKGPTLPSAPAPASPLRARLRRALSLAALTLGVGTALAGCGSSHPLATAADPASAIPASAALYAGATVRPQGAQSSEALAAGRELTHQANPYLRLLGALQTPGSPTLEFKRDVAPWLGTHAGVYLTSLNAAGPLTTVLEQGLLGGATSGSFPLGGNGAQGAIVLDTSDVAKARSFLEGQARHAGAHVASYRGVSYQLSPTGVAFAIVDRFAVIGSEAGLHGVIDTTLGGPSLADSSGYSKLLAAAPSAALAHIYSNPAGAKAQASAGGHEGVSGLLGLLSGGRQANVSLVASTGSLALDADTLSTGGASGAGGILSAGPQAAQAFGELPGESWLAIGLGNLDANLPNDIQGLQALGSLTSGSGSPGVEAPASSTLSVKSLLSGMLAPLEALASPSAQARRAFTSWMGSAGIFASGGSLLELRAAVVIESKDPARSRAAVGELGDALRKAGGTLQPVTIAGTDAAVGARLSGLPVVLDIADGRGANGHTKFVLGFGEASVAAALDPPNTLSSASSRSAAASSLGEGIQPSILVSFPTLLTLLEGVGLTEDPSISKFVPYLRAITTLAGGGREPSGAVRRFRLDLSLQPASAG